MSPTPYLDHLHNQQIWNVVSLSGRIWLMRSEQPAADAKKADGASCVALRTLIPLLHTCKVACVLAESLSRLMLRTVLKMDLSQ